MFGWFSPSCPVGAGDKAWVEERMRWLVGTFGLPRLRSATVALPTPEFFPDPYAGTEADGRALFARTCRYLGVDPAPLQLDFYTEDRQPLLKGTAHHEGTAGLYEDVGWSRRILLERGALKDPLLFVATAAHELGHLLLGQSIGAHDADQEKLTDLATVYLGFGVFTANSRIRSAASRNGLGETWSIQRLGYLTQPVVGYALALFAHVRGEHAPAWAGHLCADVRSPFRSGLRYLQKTGDSLYDGAEGRFKMLSDDEVPPGFRRGE